MVGIQGGRVPAQDCSEKGHAHLTTERTMPQTRYMTISDDTIQQQKEAIRAVEELPRPYMKIYYRRFHASVPKMDDDIQEADNRPIPNILSDCVETENDIRVTLNASALKKALFPTPERVIFISHLHCDEKRAHSLKRYLKKQLPMYHCFIDSDVWYNVYQVIDELKRTHARGKKGCFSCRPCSDITQNMLLMLSMALTEAIRHAAAFVFLPDKQNSAPSLKTIATHSPWVCQELLVSSMLRDAESKPTLIKEAAEKQVAFLHHAPIDHLKSVFAKDFVDRMKEDAISR